MRINGPAGIHCITQQGLAGWYSVWIGLVRRLRGLMTGSGEERFYEQGRRLHIRFAAGSWSAIWTQRRAWYGSPPPGANLVLLRELFRPYFCIEQYHGHLALAESFEQSRVLRRFSALARELGVVLPISWFERAGNACFNSWRWRMRMVACWGLSVRPISRTPSAIRRRSISARGYGVQGSWDTAAGRIGVGICWDQWFPEAARAMALQGAELLLYPTAIGSEPGAEGLDSRDHWQLTQRPCRRQHHAGDRRQPGGTRWAPGADALLWLLLHQGSRGPRWPRRTGIPRACWCGSWICHGRGAG